MERIEQFIQEAERLPSVSLQAATAYRDHLPEMIAFVDATLSAEPRIHALIGNNPLQLMYDNHRHHGTFMAAVFAVGSYRMLAGTLPWVYRTYHARRFSYDYFPLELKTWILAGEKHLAHDHMAAIRRVYEWMIAQHERVIVLSRQDIALEPPAASRWLPLKNDFCTAALRGDYHTCLELARSAVHTAKDIEDVYLQVLQPVLYHVGRLWEKADISVAREHLVSAIVCRVMASVNLAVRAPTVTDGRVVVAAAPDEYHEIGAMMIADILEHDGWDVAYLGGNVPDADLLQLLREFAPGVLALSVTLSYNIVNAQEVIAAIRQDTALREIRVMVGGRVFNDNEKLWQTIGADGSAVNLSDARELAQAWRGALR